MWIDMIKINNIFNIFLFNGFHISRRGEECNMLEALSKYTVSK